MVRVIAEFPSISQHLCPNVKSKFELTKGREGVRTRKIPNSSVQPPQKSKHPMFNARLIGEMFAPDNRVRGNSPHAKVGKPAERPDTTSGGDSGAVIAQKFCAGAADGHLSYPACRQNEPLGLVPHLRRPRRIAADLRLARAGAL